MNDYLNKKVNIAVQVLPTGDGKDIYAIVDEAIAIIDKSGASYRVTPFETVMEGYYDELMDVVKKVQTACYKAGAEKIMCYVKIQSSRDKDVSILDKMGKYDK
jgi:uncharacterized protein (TIGR00106 family)